MSEPAESQPPADGHAPGAEEALEALPVLVEEAQSVQARPLAGELVGEQRLILPAVQAAAVAAGGFVAGAAVVGLVHRRQRRSALARGGRGARAVGRGGASRSARAGELLQIVGSRSLLVDVHLLGGGSEDR